MLITIGIYALLGREVTTATVAAVLTVLGYSIYDTIIIFDRIRENIPLMKRGSFRTLANVSLWETIPRSLATTLITLHPDRLAARLRRRHPQGLRVRVAHRDRLGCLLVDLHRGAAARGVQGAGARVRASSRRVVGPRRYPDGRRARSSPPGPRGRARARQSRRPPLRRRRARTAPGRTRRQQRRSNRPHGRPR